MKKRSKAPAPDAPRPFFGDPPLPVPGDVVSAQDMTGLVPAIPPEQNGTEVSRQLYSVALPHPTGTDTDAPA